VNANGVLVAIYGGAMIALAVMAILAL